MMEVRSFTRTIIINGGALIVSPFCVVFYLFFCLYTCAICGEIYSYVDANGVWHFTNVPTSAKFTKFETSPNSLIIKGAGRKRTYNVDIDSIVQDVAQSFDLDPDLIKAVILAESGGDPFAVSPKGALGLMQLMPETAKEMLVDDPFDPEDNIWGGSKYLSLLLKTFDGDIINALAAYNAGPKAVEKYKGIPPYPETINYVKRVLKFWRQAKN